MTTEEIVSDITSRDSTKVWSSSCEIISMAQDRDKIFPLIEYLPEIKKRTMGLTMGGAFAPNQRFIDYAVRIIEFHKNSSACTCALYADTYDGTNPKKEVTKGNIVIEGTSSNDGDWNFFFTVRCVKCRQLFKVEEGWGHYMWWQWTKSE